MIREAGRLDCSGSGGQSYAHGDCSFTPNPGFNGERGGMKFKDGVCETEDAIRAHSCQELGYKVLNAETSEPAFPDEKEEDDGAKK